MGYVVEVPTEIADRLYAVPPRRFVAERDEAVAAARAAGDRATATAIGALRRPTVSAWLVNLLALRRPELLDELTELAAQLRAAQQEMRGGTLRDLVGRRRAVISSLVTAARSLAREVDPDGPGGTLPLAEVESTLQAALADPQIAEQIRSGRLLRPVEQAGFGVAGGETGAATGGGVGFAAGGAAAGGGAAGGHLRLVTTESGERGQADDAGARLGAEAARELAEARAAAEAAEAELERATAARRDASAELSEIDAALDELRERRVTASGRLSEAQAADLAARRAVREARQRLARAQAAAEPG